MKVAKRGSTGFLVEGKGHGRRQHSLPVEAEQNTWRTRSYSHIRCGYPPLKADVERTKKEEFHWAT